MGSPITFSGFNKIDWNAVLDVVMAQERQPFTRLEMRDNPCSVVLFDEIEKASPSLLYLFLQAFDEGWLTDGHGKRVYLSDAIVIMTSNLGSEHFRKLTSPLGFWSGQVPIEQIQGDINREVERRFPPEFRNRIDEIVLFQPLTLSEAREIALQYVDQLAATLGRWDKSLLVEPEALEKLVQDGYSLVYGARFLKRVVDERIKLPISSRWRDGSHFRVHVRGGEILVEPTLTAAARGNLARPVDPLARCGRKRGECTPLHTRHLMSELSDLRLLSNGDGSTSRTEL